MKTFLTSDWHLNHQNIKTYCQRPDDFTELILKRHNERVSIGDTTIMLGDVAIGKHKLAQEIIEQMNGKLILIRGNHDRQDSNSWWMDHGFDFSCDGMMFSNCWLTHEPANSRPGRCELNIHGHLHNIWDGFVQRMPAESDVPAFTKLKYDWQRLFAIEYTDYYPIEFQEFVNHPDRYQARGKHG